MSCIYPWDHYQGGKYVVQTVLPHMNNSDQGGSIPRNVGSLVIRDVGFDVTGRYSDLGGGGVSYMRNPLVLLGQCREGILLVSEMCLKDWSSIG